MADPQLIRCPGCGATNRVPLEKLKHGLQPVCGRCKTALLVDNKPVTVKDATWLKWSALPPPVLLDMWAPRRARPDDCAGDEELARNAGRVRVAKLNIDENPATAARFNVRSIPALLIQSRPGDRSIVGVQPKPEIARRVKQVLGALQHESSYLPPGRPARLE